MKNEVEIKKAVNKASEDLLRDIELALKAYRDYAFSLFDSKKEIGAHMELLSEGAYAPLIKVLGDLIILQAIGTGCDREKYIILLNEFLQKMKGTFIDIYGDEMEEIHKLVQKYRGKEKDKDGTPL